MIAAAIKHMFAAGMSNEAIIAAVEEMEASISPFVSGAAMRQRRYRERNKASLSVTGDAKRNPSPTPLTQEKVIYTRARGAALAEPLFEEFWGAYPRKVGKGAARKAYRHALVRASHVEILVGAKRYASSKPDPKFTKHASTWLNADCWLDEETKPNTVSLGPWKPFVPETIKVTITDEEREANLAKLAPFLKANRV